MNYKNHEFNWIEEYFNGRAEFEAATWCAAESEKRAAFERMNNPRPEKRDPCWQPSEPAGTVNTTPTPVPPEEFRSRRRYGTLLEEYLNSISPTTKKEA